MLTIGRGQHGSTYGGNPVAARVGMAALQVGGERGGGLILPKWGRRAELAAQPAAGPGRCLPVLPLNDWCMHLSGMRVVGGASPYECA